jgi:invasion protein IalB
MFQAQAPRALPLLLSLLLLLAPAALRAQVAEGQRFGDWVYECQPLSAASKACALVQVHSFGKGDVRSVRFNISRPPQGGGVGMSVVVPLGIHLPNGIRGDVDGKNGFSMTPLTCVAQGCIATVPLDAGMIEALKAGRVLNLEFYSNAGRQQVKVAGSLKGITSGLRASGLD